MIAKTPSPRYRKMTPYEWIYHSVAGGFPPFAIQLKIELHVLPSIEELERALTAAAAVNHGARLAPHGRWWIDSGKPPRIRSVPVHEIYSVSCALTQSALSFDNAPPIEVLHWQGVGLIFRCAHALMDAGGLVFFAQETFRSLRGEGLLGTTSDIGDWQYLKELHHPSPRPKLWHDRPSPLGKPIGGESGFIWRQRFIAGKVDSAAARIATAVANLHPHLGTETGCRIMMPVDLRLSQSTLRSTANCSSPVFIRSLAGGKWSDCYKEILTALERHDEHAMSSLDLLISKLPRATLARLLVGLHRWQVRNDQYVCSALSSNIGPVKIGDFRTPDADSSSITFLPFNSPGMALSLLTMQHDHGLEIAASSPLATGGEGRLDGALDEICAELRRGVASQERRVLVERPTTAFISIAASFVAEPMRKPLDFWLEKLELPFALRFAPYAQIFQSLIDPNGIFSCNPGGINVILLRLEDWVRDAGDQWDAGGLKQRLEDNVEELLAAIESAVQRTGTPFMIWVGALSIESKGTRQAGNSLEPLQTLLLSRLRSMAGVSLLCADDHARYYPVQKAENACADQLGHIPYTQLLYTAIATLIARRVFALHTAPVKAIVVDCDDTLWDGVCSESGPSGIRITPPHRALQKFLVQQASAGILLCLCSKNDPDDVRAVFESRKDMELSFEQIVSSRINWQKKSENVTSLARELNIAFDSIVFIDNSPVECLEVQANCYGVQAIQLPEVIAALPEFLQHIWIGDLPAPTYEASQRATMYRQNQARETLRSAAVSYSSFLDSLGLEVTVLPLESTQIERAVELTQRTNRFNLRPFPRHATQLRAMDATLHCLSIEVNDRFGSYGMAGLVFYENAGSRIRVDTFLLSCRVLGRGVEHQVLSALGRIALQAGCGEIVFPYSPTERNQTTAAFLASVCVSPHGALPAGDFKFSISADRATRVRPDALDAQTTVATDTAEASALLSGRQLRPGLLNEIAHDYRDVAKILNAAAMGSRERHPATTGTADWLMNELREIVMNVAEGELGDLLPDASLTDAGLDSLHMVMVLTEAAQRFAPHVSTQAFYSGIGDLLHHCTLDNLKEYLIGVGELEAQAASRRTL